jgi:hypothetical protein
MGTLVKLGVPDVKNAHSLSEFLNTCTETNSHMVSLLSNMSHQSKVEAGQIFLKDQRGFVNCLLETILKFNSSSEMVLKIT